MEEKMCRLNELAPGQREDSQSCYGRRYETAAPEYGIYAWCSRRMCIPKPVRRSYGLLYKGNADSSAKEDAGRIWIIRE